MVCVTKGNILFFVLLSLFQGPFFSKNSFGYPLFFRRVLKLCMFLLNVECDEFVLRGQCLSFYESLLYAWWMTRIKISCIERSLFVYNAFAHRGWSLC